MSSENRLPLLLAAELLPNSTLEVGSYDSVSLP